jgi:phage repressor protein C with HTH and peptisase S24 domain
VRWLTAAVRGPSMVPTLYDGDRVLARRGARVRPGDVVLGRFADLDRLVVKRAVRPCPGAAGEPAAGWWLASDNRYAAGDSAVHGPAEVVARVVWRYRPLRRPR